MSLQRANRQGKLSTASGRRRHGTAGGGGLLQLAHGLHALFGWLAGVPGVTCNCAWRAMAAPAAQAAAERREPDAEAGHSSAHAGDYVIVDGHRLVSWPTGGEALA